MTTHQQKPTNTNEYMNNPTMDEDYLYAASCRDSTGLTPTVAHNEYEAESYQELNHYLPPVIPTQGSKKLPQHNTDKIHLRASDGIHAEMRMKVKPQSEFKRKK